MKTAYITIGISASGKTTWANDLSASTGAVIICRDDIRRKILEDSIGRKLNPGELWTKWRFSRENEVTAIAEQKLSNASSVGADVIIADTNLDASRRNALVKKLEDLGYDVVLKCFDISYEDAIKRDNARQDGVGHSVIMKQWLQYQSEFGIEKFVPVTNHKAIIVDIDGTLAHMNKRSAFDWDKVDTDTVDPVVRSIVNHASNDGYTVVVLSGRDGSCRTKTEKWLVDNNVKYDALFMRDADDMRKDTIVKLELFNRHVRSHYDVQYVIDDRPQVCRVWQALGLKVLQVGNPYIEF